MARTAVIRIYGDDGFLIRHVTRRESGELQRTGDWEPIFFHGKFWGLQHVRKHPQISKPVITVGDMLANARITNGDPGNPAPNETRIQAAQDKINAWPHEHDTRAPVIAAGVPHQVTTHSETESLILLCAWPKWDSDYYRPSASEV